MGQDSSETIAAIATARGRAALAIVRLSGDRAVAIAGKCFRGTDLEASASHTAHVGYVLDEEGEPIDQVVATVFRAPRSATGENVVEISCHGGNFAPSLILQSLVARGARLAEPGEYTERAFLNGKMDLAQAEAVADLIHASSSMAHRVSLQQLQGRYSELLEDLRQELLDTCALVELELDFSEEDVDFADHERLKQLLDEAARLVDTLLGSYTLGEKLRDGVRVVIGGRPNAGKSTLLNALTGRDRAIVSATPGTTRDAVEAEVEIEGLLFRFVDTAGLRETADAIEAEGVRRAEQTISTSDVLLYVYDLAEGFQAADETFLQRLQNEEPELPVLLIGNKDDLVVGGGNPAHEDPVAAHSAGNGHSAADATSPPAERPPILRLSATEAFRQQEALQPLIDRLTATVAAGLADADASPVVMNQRHLQHLRQAREALRRTRRALAAGMSGDMLTLDLRAALDELGAITGKITNEDVLGQIFSRFCIGK